MIQRLLGVAIGALVSFGLLWFNHLDSTAWATAVIAGAVVAFLWPTVVGWYLSRRSRNRRENRIEAEVNRRVIEQTQDIPPR